MKTRRVTDRKLQNKKSLNKKFLLMTAILIVVTTFCATGTMQCQAKNNNPLNDNGCKIAEKEYINQMKEKLEAEGYKNCGITMTNVTEENNERIYTVRIHHKGISRLNEAEKEQLKEKLRQISFSEKNSGLYHEFFDNLSSDQCRF